MGLNDVVRFPGCLTLSDRCVVRSKDGDVQCFSECMSWLVERRFLERREGLRTRGYAVCTRS